MKLILVAIKDTASQSFDYPQTCRAKGEALRNFTDAINDPNNRQLHQHAADFELYQVGTFDQLTGNVEAQEPELLMRGKDAAAQKGISITAR